MIRNLLILIALLSLTACAQVDLPQSECPREGGIGGTGDCDTQTV